MRTPNEIFNDLQNGSVKVDDKFYTKEDIVKIINRIPVVFCDKKSFKQLFLEELESE